MRAHHLNFLQALDLICSTPPLKREKTSAVKAALLRPQVKCPPAVVTFWVVAGSRSGSFAEGGQIVSCAIYWTLRGTLISETSTSGVYLMEQMAPNMQL